MAYLCVYVLHSQPALQVTDTGERDFLRYSVCNIWPCWCFLAEYQWTWKSNEWGGLHEAIRSCGDWPSGKYSVCVCVCVCMCVCVCVESWITSNSLLQARMQAQFWQVVWFFFPPQELKNQIFLQNFPPLNYCACQRKQLYKSGCICTML